MAVPSSTEGKARPKMTVGSELTEVEPFLAQVMVDEWTDGEYGEQWHVAVKPIRFNIGGKTGMFHEYYSPSTRLTSKCGACLAGLKGIGIAPETPIGEGALIGTVAWFVRKDMKFGKNRDTGEDLESKGVLLPHHAATEDEAKERPTEGGTTAAPAATPASPDWDDDQIAAVMQVIVGKKQAQFQIAAARSKIAPELKNAILSGAAVRALTEMGLIEVGSDGVVGSTLDAGSEEGGAEEEGPNV